MSAASTSVQAAPTNRQAGGAAFGLGLAALAVLAVVAYGQLSTTGQTTAPAAGAGPVQHDHGWSSAAGQAVAPAAGAAFVQHDHGWSSTEGSAGSASAVATESAASGGARDGSFGAGTVTSEGIRVTGSAGGSILYNGIPSASNAARNGSLRSVTVTPEGIRVTGSGGAAILYNGIPYGSFGAGTGTGSVQDKLDSEYLRSISAGWGSKGAGGTGGSNRLRLAQ